MICVSQIFATEPSTLLSSDKEQVIVSSPSRAGDQKGVKRSMEPPVHTTLPTTQIPSVNLAYNLMNIYHLTRQGAITKLNSHHTHNQVLNVGVSSKSMIL